MLGFGFIPQVILSHFIHFSKSFQFIIMLFILHCLFHACTFTFYSLCLSFSWFTSEFIMSSTSLASLKIIRGTIDLSLENLALFCFKHSVVISISRYNLSYFFSFFSWNFFLYFSSSFQPPEANIPTVNFSADSLFYVCQGLSSQLLVYFIFGSYCIISDALLWNICISCIFLSYCFFNPIRNYLLFDRCSAPGLTSHFFSSSK